MAQRSTGRSFRGHCARAKAGCGGGAITRAAAPGRLADLPTDGHGRALFAIHTAAAFGRRMPTREVISAYVFTPARGGQAPPTRRGRRVERSGQGVKPRISWRVDWLVSRGGVTGWVIVCGASYSAGGRRRLLYQSAISRSSMPRQGRGRARESPVELTEVTAPASASRWVYRIARCTRSAVAVTHEPGQVGAVGPAAPDRHLQRRPGPSPCTDWWRPASRRSGERTRPGAPRRCPAGSARPTPSLPRRRCSSPRTPARSSRPAPGLAPRERTRDGSWRHSRSTVRSQEGRELAAGEPDLEVNGTFLRVAELDCPSRRRSSSSTTILFPSL